MKVILRLLNEHARTNFIIYIFLFQDVIKQLYTYTFGLLRQYKDLCIFIFFIFWVSFSYIPIIQNASTNFTFNLCPLTHISMQSLRLLGAYQPFFNWQTNQIMECNKSNKNWCWVSAKNLRQPHALYLTTLFCFLIKIRLHLTRTTVLVLRQ